MGIQEAVAPGSQGEVKISKYEWGTPEGTKEMKRITPGESKVKAEAKEADYGEKFQSMMKRVKVSAQSGPKKTVFIPAKYGTGGSYKVVPDNKVKESVEVEPMRLEATKLPFLLMSAEQKRSLFEETNQLEFDGVQTKNLDLCPKAYIQFKELIEVAKAGNRIGQSVNINEPSNAVQSVVAGINAKPNMLRNMQFRQYTGL